MAFGHPLPLRRVLGVVAVFVASLVTAASAAAAPVVGPAGSAFYNAPSPVPSVAHGTLIQYRPAVVNLGGGAPAVSAYDVMYASQDSTGTPDVVTGTVLVPTALWSGSGTRPLITYAPGTQGLAQQCAPSIQMANGTEYENANIAAALKAGYAVSVTDYQGYTTGATPTYIAGQSEGHAVLDAATAAFQIPSIGLSSSTKVAIWGYSQGGQAAAWAGQLESSYSSSLKIAGVAAGGIPGNLATTADYLNGGNGAAFAAMAIVGLATQYPSSIPLASLENPAGAVAIASLKGECVFQALPQFNDDNIDQFTVNNETLDQLLATPAISSVVNAQNLGATKIPVPLYQYHGQADEFIPLAQAEALKSQYCSDGSNVTFQLYPSEHIATQFQAASTVLTWLGQRFAGNLVLGNCTEFASKPTSTALPPGGDLTVALNSWALGGSVALSGLGQTIALPSGGTFTATADVTKNTLSGNLSIPTFTAPVKVAGIGTNVTIGIVPTKAATGSVSLDTSGNLHISGTATANIELKSVALGILTLGTGCITSSPVNFPLSFNGPVSSLGDGQLSFSGTTNFPSLTGCGLYNAPLSLLFSTNNNGFTFTVAPPAPTSW
jgi:hypothetical protein